MKPTAGLRWLEREVYVGCGDFEILTTLQQLWVPDLSDAVGTQPEWRDVPRERE